MSDVQMGQVITLGDSLDIVTGGDNCFRVPAYSMVTVVAVTKDGFDVEWEPLDDYGPIRFEILHEDVIPLYMCEHSDEPEIEQCEYCLAYPNCFWHK